MTSPFLYQNTPPAPGWRVLGAPGASLGSSGFDDAFVQAGAEGERRVAAVLDALADRHDNVRALHSVKLPGHYGDIDHIIIIGRRVIPIDAKNWRADADYTIASDEKILRDGAEFAGGDVSIARYAREISDISGRPCRGILAIANRRSRTGCATRGSWSLRNLDELERDLAAIAEAEAGHPVDSRVAAFLAERVVNPHYTGSWDAIVEAERATQKRATRTAAPSARREGGGIGCLVMLVQIVLLLWVLSLNSTAILRVLGRGQGGSADFILPLILSLAGAIAGFALGRGIFTRTLSAVLLIGAAVAGLGVLLAG